MNSTSGLSVIVITWNEEIDIARCLKSVEKIADEIIVVDSGSTDKTLEIVRRFTGKIFHNEWNGYSAQKQFALDRAEGPWVLNIDADESVSLELELEIQAIRHAAAPPSFQGYTIPFHHYFLGRRLRYGGGQGETHLRLFRKEHASYGTARVHEGIQVSGPVGALTGHIDHFSYRDIADYLRKCDWYTSLIAKQKFAAGKRFHWTHHLRLPYEFFTRYFLRGGFLDGEAGLTYAVLSSYYVWLKFLKLRDLTETK